MKLRQALNDYKRTRGAERLFPGERRSTRGLFSGLDGRLVHVGPDGALRDYSYPLTGLHGLERSRFGVAAGGETTWFDEFETVEQGYLGEGTTVETRYHLDGLGVSQFDRTLGTGHVTHVVATGEVPADASLVAYVGFGPDGAEGQLARLDHGDAVEVYHDREHDYFAADPGIADLAGQVPEGLSDLLDDAPVEYPRPTEGVRYEDAVLSGEFVATVPLTGEGDRASATVATLLSTHATTGRETALSRVRELAGDYGDPAAMGTADGRRPVPDVPGDTPHRAAVVADLRVLALLAATNGARVAGPDFDPFYTTSGGYGYTWFRDDAEIARFLLGAAETLDLDLADWHDRSVDVYWRTQRADGSWPHRVWPYNERLAPGWANARLSAGDDTAYQADQTASVVAFLATYLRTGDPGDPQRVRTTIGEALDALDETVADDGLPVACQNAWENDHGRFTHTAATFLAAYAAVARAPLARDLRDRARDRATRLAAGLDTLWSPDRDAYGMCLRDGDLDDRLDSATLALVEAHRGYDAVAGVGPERRDRLVAHVETTLTDLRRETDAVSGLVRFEGDDWRRREQDREKVWTVSTAWGANAAAQLGTLLAAHDDERADRFYEHSRTLLAELLPGGSLVQPSGYLPEQVFDDGTPDCATPLGWPHALRLATVAHLHAADALAPRADAEIEADD